MVGTVATAARTGRTVVFVEGHHERVTHRSHAIDYVPTRLDEHHVRASAAIPILFPPVRVDEPRDARGWYVDGGTRLNTPIKPALDLGAERLVVVATDSVAEPSSRSGRHDMQPPDFGDGALHVLQGMLVDPVVEDMRILGNINMFFADKNGQPRRSGATRTGRRATDAATERYRAARGKKPYRMIPYIFIAPEKRGAIGRLAREVFKDRYGGWKGLRSVDFPLLNRLLGRREPAARGAAQLPVLRPRVHRGADPHGRARRAPLAAGRSRPRRSVADRAAGRVHAPERHARDAARRARRPPAKAKAARGARRAKSAACLRARHELQRAAQAVGRARRPAREPERFARARRVERGALHLAEARRARTAARTCGRRSASRAPTPRPRSASTSSSTETSSPRPTL